jgi:hypothetical protein
VQTECVSEKQKGTEEYRQTEILKRWKKDEKEKRKSRQ